MGNNDSHEAICKIQISKDIMNTLSKNDWNMESVDRSIDIQKAKIYLDDFKDERKKDIAKTIIDNTIYVNFLQFKDTLLQLLKKLPPKYNIYFNTNCKIGSEHWIVILLWKYIKDNCVQLINHGDTINNDYPIILFDDCIYSGCNMCGSLEAITYDTPHIVNNKIIAAVPYLVNGGDSHLINEFKIDVIYQIKLPSINNIIDKYDYDEMYSSFGCETMNVSPVYFDHKIANEFGSFPNFYNKIIKNPTSRYKIVELLNLLKKLINTPE